MLYEPSWHRDSDLLTGQRVSGQDNHPVFPAGRFSDHLSSHLAPACQHVAVSVHLKALAVPNAASLL